MQDTAKAWAGGAGVPAAMVFVASWIAELWAGIEVPTEVQAAMALIVGAAGGLAVYLIPNKEG